MSCVFPSNSLLFCAFNLLNHYINWLLSQLSSWRVTHVEKVLRKLAVSTPSAAAHKDMAAKKYSQYKQKSNAKKKISLLLPRLAEALHALLSTDFTLPSYTLTMTSCDATVSRGSWRHLT